MDKPPTQELARTTTQQELARQAKFVCSRVVGPLDYELSTRCGRHVYEQRVLRGHQRYFWTSSHPERIRVGAATGLAIGTTAAMGFLAIALLWPDRGTFNPFYVAAISIALPFCCMGLGSFVVWFCLDAWRRPE